MASSGSFQRRRTPIIVCLALLIVVWFLLIPSDSEYLPQINHLPEGTPFEFFNRARRELSLDLSPSIKYSQRCIRPSFSVKAERQSVVKVSEPLVVNQIVLPLDGQGELHDKLPKCTPVRLEVSEPYPAGEKFRNLIFGMSTSYERLRDSLDSIAHWGANTGVKLFVIVIDWGEQGAPNVSRLQQEYRARGILASFLEPIDPSHTASQSHFMVLTSMVKESGPQTKWFGLLDDDTFFPHLKPLSDTLGRIDHTTDVYVGTLAEDFGSIRNFGLMGYGGAGVYLSAHLARKLGAPEQAERCLQEATPDFGDVIVRDCVYHYSKAKLTVLPGL
jgi:hypothetical protein